MTRTTREDDDGEMNRVGVVFKVEEESLCCQDRSTRVNGRPLGYYVRVVLFLDTLANRMTRRGVGGGG